MPDEADTEEAEAPETDHVEPSPDDNPASVFDYRDPDEDTVETEEADGTDDETDEAKAEDEAESQEAEDDEDKPEQAAPDDNAEVDLPDGTKQTLGELKNGYLRQSDYTRKAQDVANIRRTTEAEAQRIAKVADAFVNHVANMLPPEPPPALAQADPAQYTRQKAAFDAAVAQVQSLVEIGGQAQETASMVSQEDHQRLLSDENSSLAAMFPETAKPESRKAFFDTVSEAATSLGYSPEELSRVTDHRLIALAFWAKRGMDGEKAKEQARAKVKDAPPTAPRKPGQSASKAGQSRKAMQRARSTGSLDDALNVDFDF